jgi:hypothetical protein
LVGRRAFAGVGRRAVAVLFMQEKRVVVLPPQRTTTPDERKTRGHPMSSDPEYTPSGDPRSPSFRMEDLLSPQEASRLTGHPVTVLAQYRRRRTSGEYPDAGPEFVVFGRSVLYTRAAVEAYVRKRGV